MPTMRHPKSSRISTRLESNQEWFDATNKSLTAQSLPDSARKVHLRGAQARFEAEKVFQQPDTGRTVHRGNA